MVRLILFALLVGAAPARAADLYAVEVVIFERLRGEAVPGGELLPADGGARDLASASTAASPYARLAEPDLALTAQARRLEANGAFRVLAHGGWWQRAGAGAAPVRIDALGADLNLGEALTGTVRVYQTQVLHVAADIALVRDTGVGADGSVQRLRTRRGLRPGEVHYLDHPAIGALVQVRAAP